MLRSFLSALGFVLVASSAAAQTITTPPVQGHTHDTVVLKDGTVLGGTVAEMTPGQSLTIVLPNGQKRTIEWTAVERVDIDRAKAAPAQATVTQSATTMVHVDGVGPDVELQRLDEHGTEDTWTAVCRGACDSAVPSSAMYRIDGPGLRSSKPFRVDGQSTQLEVHPAHGAAFAGGLTLVILGGAALVNGIGFLLIEAIDRSAGYYGNDSFLIAGGVLCGVGLPMLIGGAIWMKSNGRTTITSGATTLRVPAWRETPAMPSSRIGAVTFPALGGSF